MKKLSIFVTTSIIAISVHAASPSMATDDGALVAHIKKSDYIFTTALGECSDEKVVRSIRGGVQSFEYIGYCTAKAAEESDCSGYKIRASGTVDSANAATLRNINLELQCHG